MEFYSGYLKLINGRVTAAYLEISSMIHRYNRFNYIEISEYRNITLTDTITFNELGD